MIGKFESVLRLKVLVCLVGAWTIVMAGKGLAQQTNGQSQSGQAPAAQTPTTQAPAAQPDSSQQSQETEMSSQRRVRPKDYRNWTFNVGGGASLTAGTTHTYAKSGGAVAAAGVARNANKYFGLQADFMWADLPLRGGSALNLAQAPGASSHAYILALDPIINLPVSKKDSGYVLFGPAFYHRSGMLDSSSTLPGAPCNGFWEWWGACSNASVPLSGDFLKSNLNQFGYNVGGGVARKVHNYVEIYAEYRLMHGTHNNIKTDVRPITLGVRW